MDKNYLFEGCEDIAIILLGFKDVSIITKFYCCESDDGGHKKNNPKHIK